jgi:hypothetical protein
MFLEVIIRSLSKLEAERTLNIQPGTLEPIKNSSQE